MALSPLFTVLRSQDPRAVLRIFRDWRGLLRLHFLHAALDSGLLRALARPRKREELLAELEVERPDLLDALLEVGVSVGELAFRGEEYRIRGSRSRALRKEKNDALAAMVEANVTYYNGAFRGFARRLRGGPLDPGVADIGPLVARVSKLTEPYLEHFLRRVVRGEGPLRVLDVGCGSGVHLRSVLDRNPGVRGVGLELDPEVVRQGRENVASWGLEERLGIFLGDIRNPPEEVRGPFDLILFFSVVYYFPVPERIALLRGLRGRLAPGGRLVVTTTCRGPGMDAFSANLNLTTTSMEGLTPLPSVEEMEAQLSEAGFGTISATRLIPGTTFFGFVAS